MIGSNRARDL